MAAIPFTKGHGTENDFVVVPDPDDALELTPEAVARICARRAGVGADGVLRVVRSAAHAEGAAMAGEAEWFMDYRNADGSVAEMCGNGVRVFAAYLRERGWAGDGDVAIATRGGVKIARFEPDGQVTVDMGEWSSHAPGEVAPPFDGEPVVTVADRSWPAVRLFLPNPHAVVFVDDLAEAGDLLEPPAVTPLLAYPQGVNVEFVVDAGERHVALRVHERGSGETRSCGTGACAAAVAAARRAVDEVPSRWTVDVPGGRVHVTLREDGHVELTGPAVLLADGELRPEWLAGE